MSRFAEINAKVEQFIDRNNLFLACCNHAFNTAEKVLSGNTISQVEASRAIDEMFDDVTDLFDHSGIKLIRLTKRDIMKCIRFSNLQGGQVLTDMHFYLICRKVLNNLIII